MSVNRPKNARNSGVNGRSVQARIVFISLIYREMYENFPAYPLASESNTALRGFMPDSKSAQSERGSGSAR